MKKMPLWKNLGEKQLPCLVVVAAAVKTLGARFVINQCAVRSQKPRAGPKYLAAMFPGNAEELNELSFRVEKVPAEKVVCLC